MLTVIDNHSVDLSLVTQGGAVLDAGSRGFRFSKYFASFGCAVVAMDPMKEEEAPAGVKYFEAALVTSGHPYVAYLRMTEDPEARHVTLDPKSGDPRISCMTLPQVMADSRVGFWDLVKLNIEGGEFDVLRTWPGPVARQIVVSFHEHCSHSARGDGPIAGVLDYLSQWYRVVQHSKEPRYGCTDNFWDTVLVLK